MNAFPHFRTLRVSESATFIALGTDAVEPVRWGLWLSMFGS